MSAVPVPSVWRRIGEEMARIYDAIEAVREKINPTPGAYYGTEDNPPDYDGWSFWVVWRSEDDHTPIDVRTPA